MSKPVSVVLDYRTRHRDMQDAINGASPRRNPVVGVMIGFACTIALVWSAIGLLAGFFG